MNSLRHLYREWEAQRDILLLLIEQSKTGHVIHTDGQYATAAWHNMLVAWRTELIDLMAQYSSLQPGEACEATTDPSARPTSAMQSAG